MRKALVDAGWQTTFPVLEEDKKLVGLVSAVSIGLLAPDNAVHAAAVTADVMQPATILRSEDDLRTAAELILESGLRQLPVVGADDTIVGFLEESEVTRAYLSLATRRDES